MRFIIFILGVLVGFKASADGVAQAKDFRLTCVNSVAQMMLFADGDRFHLHFQDPQGAADFPIYSGNVSPSNVAEVDRAAKELTPFQQEMEISWDLSKCQVDPKRPFLISCRGMGEIATPENSDFAVTGLNTSTEAGDEIGIQSFTMVNISFFLVGKPELNKADVMDHYIKLPFDQMHCSVNTPTIQ